MKAIQNSMSLSPITDTRDALSKLKELRWETAEELNSNKYESPLNSITLHCFFIDNIISRYQLDNDLSPLTKTPGLDSELDKLQDLLERFTLEYNAKKNATENISNIGQERLSIRCNSTDAADDYSCIKTA